MTRYWRIRVGDEDVAGKCINDCCIAVGWGPIDNLCSRDEEELIDILRDWPKYTTPQSLGIDLRQIRNFCNIQIGEGIILYNSGSIWEIGEVNGSYRHEEREDYIGWSQYKPHEIRFYNKMDVNWWGRERFELPIRVRGLKTLSRGIINKLNTMPTILELEAAEWNDILGNLTQY